MSPLLDLLQQQEDTLNQMLALLEEEFGLLKQRKALALPELTEKKQQLLATLAQNDHAIAEALPDTNLQQEFAAFRQRILSQLQACQERNEVNGKLIELNLLSNRKLAAELCQLRDKNKLTYDNRGNTQPGKNGSLNIKA
ncbi:flagellar protein FlgN [Pseudaeromonas paramecii]|uniref:Flagellar protein FlgN n=1 Tax=Pseudaeromonas paramecii TaxID=2138166 RepID=A0ABP8Q300_9GAMM